MLSIITGLMGGLAAVLLKNLVHFGQNSWNTVFHFSGHGWYYFVLPAVGIVLTTLFTTYWVRDNIGHGISRILQAISRSNSLIRFHNTYTSLIASSITVIFGGSVGLEAPIVLTGSAMGSNLGRYLRLDYKTITLLIGCGSASAIAGIFKAPVAGVIFAMEVLMLDLTMSSLVPLLISSATGAILAYFFMGHDVLFSFEASKQHPFSLQNLPFYILLGGFTGIVSLYFTRANQTIEKQFQKLPKGAVRTLVGAGITGLLIFLFPPLFGEGYATLTSMINGQGIPAIDYGGYFTMGGNFFGVIVLVSMLLIFKVVAMSATNGGGGVGGVFAPSLFMGGISGYLLAHTSNFFIGHRLPEPNFVLAGMAGVMAAVMHAPLTAIFLIAEITGGYQLFVPLMITSVVAYLTIMPFEPHSIYTKRLAEAGELITHDKDKAVLSRLSIEKLIETNFITTSPDITLGEFVKLVAKSQRNVFPVVDADMTFLGVIFINDIRHIIFEHEQYDKVFIRNLMFMPDTWVDRHATMEDVARKFAESADYNIPVLDQGKYVGFVSRANVFSAYRKLVKDFSND